MDLYETWIAEYAARAKLYGQCEPATKEMAAAFPELSIVRGHVIDGRWGKRAHWWLVTPAGEIVDPTAAQFPALFEYEPWSPGQEVRVGRCMNCGDDIYLAVDTLDIEPPQKCICSEACARAFDAYLAEET